MMEKGADDVNLRKSLVLMFTDIANSTALSSEMEIEDYAELIAQFRTCLMAAVEPHKGMVVRIDGDGALCVFGYPDALEDAGRRAIEAALDMHAAIAALPKLINGRPLDVHTGIHAGMIVVQDGDKVRGVIEVLGKPTNIAARLCDLARPNRIMVSKEVLGSDRHFFSVEPAGTFSTASDGEPVLVEQVKGRSSARQRLIARWHQGGSPFLGRSTDVEAILSWLDEPDRSVMLVHGEAGIGKSRFIAELRQFVTDAQRQSALGSCEAYPIARPLQALLHIAADLDVIGNTDQPPEGVVSLLKRRIADFTKDRLLLIIIDDWQWADDATVSFVEWLLALERPKLKIMMVSREGDVRITTTSAYANMALGNLPEDDTLSLIGVLLPQADPLLVRRISEAAGGSPLMIEELCHNSTIVHAGGAAMPTNIRLSALVSQRLATVTPDLSQAITICSVIGIKVPAWLLAAVLGWPEQQRERNIALLQTTGFFRFDPTADTLYFRHGLIRDAVYVRISLHKRRAIHGQVAAALLAHDAQHGGGEDVEAQALHFAASGDVSALQFLIKAGDRARALGSLDRALAHYRTAIHTLLVKNRNPSAGDINRLGARYISAALPDPHAEHLKPLQLLADLAHRYNWPDTENKARYWLGSLHYAMGEPRGALASIGVDAGSQMQKLQAEEVGELTIALVGQSFSLCNYHPRACELLGAAITHMKAKQNPTIRESLIYMLGMRGQILGDQGNFHAAIADFAEASNIAGEQQPSMFGTVLSQRAAVELWAENYDACRNTMQQSRDMGDRVGSRYVMMISRALLAYVDYLQHRSEGTLEALERSIRWFTETGSRYSLSLSYGWAANVAMLEGQRNRAHDHARRSIALGSSGLRWGSPLAYRVAALTSNEPDECQGLLHRSYASALRMQSPREWAETLLTHATLLDRKGQPHEATVKREAANHLRAAMGLAPCS